MNEGVKDIVKRIMDNYQPGMTIFGISWDNPEDILVFELEKIRIDYCSADFVNIVFYLTYEKNPMLNTTFTLSELDEWYFSDLEAAQARVNCLTGKVKDEKINEIIPKKRRQE